MAARALRGDPDGADEIASDCFDRYIRIYGECGVENYKAWVGRSIAGLRKNYVWRQWKDRVTLDETHQPMERIRPAQIDQETLFDIQRWKEKIEGLDERARDAFLIIADGGTVKDIMDELGIGPSEALAIVQDARQQLKRAA